RRTTSQSTTDASANLSPVNASGGTSVKATLVAVKFPAQNTTTSSRPATGETREEVAGVVGIGLEATSEGQPGSPIFPPYAPVPDPQLLHRRPHRPRQVDPGRSADRAHRHRHQAGDARADHRHDGPRAR